MNPPKRLKIGLALFFLVVFFVVLNLTPLGKSVKNFFYSVSSPVQKTLWRTGDKISGFLTGFFLAEKLNKENENLRLKIQELLIERNSLSELKKENEILRTALDIGLEKEFKLQLSEVIGKDIFQDYILINKGIEDGISKNFPVITQEKVLIGKIKEVYNNFSKVLLISNPESSFDAKLSETEIFGIVKGEGNLKAFLDFIPKEKEIKKGDLVISSSLGGIFPEGLLVGEITQIEKLDVKPFQTATIKPAFNLGEIEKLFIVTGF